MKRLSWLLSLIIVISDPYSDIDYDEINVYIFQEDCEEKCIEVYEALKEWEFDELAEGD